MKKKMIIGNWKMNLLYPEAHDLLQKLAAYPLPAHLIAGVCPSFLWIPLAVEQLRERHWIVAGQNTHAATSGAYTGDISAPMLHSAGCSHCLVGHSERRQGYGESDDDVAEKVVSLLAAGVTPILCVGETLEERESNQAETVVRRQVFSVLKELSPEAGLFPIAYEPVWAIGTGVHCDPETAKVMMQQIRQEIAYQRDEKQAEEVTLLYGGSVKASNIAEYLQISEIDGALVGGASLKVTDFLAILDQAGGVKHARNT